MREKEAAFGQRVTEMLEKFSGDAGAAVKAMDGSFCWEWQSGRLFSTASTVKIFVLGAILRQCEQGKLSLHERIALREKDLVDGGILCELEPGLMLTVQDAAMLMIALSDNTATNLLIDLAGGPEEICRHMESCGIVRSRLNRRLSEDPEIMAQCHLADVCCADFVEYLTAVKRGSVFSEENTALFLSMLEKQRYKDFVPRFLPLAEEREAFGIPEERCVDAACKTGWDPGTRCDTGYLTMGGTTYVYAVMLNNCRDMRPTIDNEGAVLLAKIGQALYETVID